jgi:hypothetical protein
LQQANGIKLKLQKEEQDSNNAKCDKMKRSWYEETMSKLQDKLHKSVTSSLNFEVENAKFENAKLLERQKIEKEMKSLGEYKGQCLHLGGKTSRWITNQYDSHGYKIESCSMCGATI